MSRIFIGTILALALLLAAPGVARANDVELSKEHFRRGMKLSELGKHTESIREFELAYEANPRPSILYNLAHEHRVLAEAGAIDQMRQSVDFYQRYLMASPKAPDRRPVETMITELKARIETAEATARDSAKSPAPVAPAKPLTPNTAHSDETEAAAAAVSKPAPDPAKSEKKGVPTWGWVVVGVGAAVVVGGAVGLGVGLSQPAAPPDSTLGGFGGIGK